MTKSAPIEKFFADYAVATRSGDADTIASFYADTYIEAAPSSVAAYEVDDEYRRALGEKFTAMTGQLGFSDVSVVVQTSSEFAPKHYLVEAEWTMKFDRADSGPVQSIFRISYVIRLENGAVKILLYVSHEDEEAAMKRDGVLPE